MRTILAALAAAGALVMAPSPSLAQAPAKDQLAAELMGIIFKVGGLETKLRQELPAFSRELSGEAWFKPEWRALLEQAAVEEIEHDLPRMQSIMGRAFAAEMTVAELQAGIALMRAGGEAFMTAGASGARPKLSRKQEAEAARIMGTPAGRSFVDKMGRAEMDDPAVQNALVAELVPGVFRRFGEKVEKAEAAPR